MPMAKPPKDQNPHVRVKSVEAVMRYPLAFLTIWHETIVEPPQQPTSGELRLAMSSDEARKIGEKFLQLAQSIDAFGGSEQ
jgi:hypothetical protein